MPCPAQGVRFRWINKTAPLLKKKQVLRETARHITRGLEIVGPQCMQERAVRRMRAEADMDEFRAGIHNDRGFGNDFRSERGQAA